MNGVLEADGVRVLEAADANRIHNKGSFGQPESGNSLHLSKVEAAYLVRQGRLAVEGQAFADLLADDVEYLAYADLRDRGLVVRHDGPGFAVWDRGQGPPKDPAWTCHVVAEREGVSAATLRTWSGHIVAVVDEDGAVTHYQVCDEAPEGIVQAVDLPRITGRLLRDRVLVDDATAHREEHYGTPHADGLILSFTEAEALRRRGVLDIPDVTEQARARQLHFDRTLPVYLDLRRRGVVARSGFRFGTHLRGYRTGPDEGHAQWLIHCARPDDVVHWSTLSRGVRLAHGVRKTFLVADAEACTYTSLSWHRP